MKFSIRLLTLLLLAASFFTACQKENINEIITVDPGDNTDAVKVNNLFKSLQTDAAQEGATMGCILIEYPFEMVQQSGSAITINSKSTLTAALAESAEDKAVDFKFPMNIIDVRGEKAQVQSNKELGRQYASCIPQTGWTTAMSTNETLPACYWPGLFCFDLVYPVNLVDDAGNNYTAQNEDEFIDLFVSVEGDLSFVLPLTVIDENGNQVTIENMDDFFDAAGECESINPMIIRDEFIEFEFIGFACYQLAYPTEFLDANGNTIIVNNADEYANLVLSGEALELNFPFSLIDDENMTVVVNNIQDLIGALNACGLFEIIITEPDLCETPSHVLLFFNRGGAAMNPCRFNVNFPVDLVALGSSITVNNMTEYYAVYNAYQLNEIEVVFPVSVTVNSTGDIIEFAEAIDLCNYIDDCN